MPRPPLLQLPPDSTVVERKIIEYGIANIYRKLDHPLDKFIVAFRFDMGNTSSATAVAAGVSRKTIWERTKIIKTILKGIK